jgi:AraC-like DNA-binding protein
MTLTYDDWLHRAEAAVDALQQDLLTIDVRAAKFVLREFGRSLAPPPGTAARALFAIALLDVCRRVTVVFHEQEITGPCTCHSLSWQEIDAFLDWRSRDPTTTFLGWIDAFFRHLEDAHPVSSEARAADLIRRDPARAWILEDLAREVNTPPARLRQRFAERFAMRPSAYVHLARAIRAIALLGTALKIDAIAREVGYRSKKDLYAALRRWAGSTPTELRWLPDDEREWLQRELRIKCLRGLGSGQRQRLGGAADALCEQD